MCAFSWVCFPFKSEVSVSPARNDSDNKNQVAKFRGGKNSLSNTFLY